MQRVSGLACFNQYSSLEMHLHCCLYQYRCSLRVRSKPIISWKCKKMRKTRPNTLASKHSTLWCVVCLLIVWLRGWLPSTEQCVAHTWVRSGSRIPSVLLLGVSCQYSEPVTASLGSSVAHSVLLLCSSVSIWLYHSSGFFVFVFKFQKCWVEEMA